MSKKANNLTRKQEIFSKEYVKLGDASAAYRIAYNASGWKDKSVHENASKLLKDPKISTRVDHLKKITSEIAEKEFKINSKEILKHLDILRKSRIDQYVNFIETEERQTILQFKPFDKLTEEQLMCIESIKHGKYGTELKLHGKDWTIEKISKHIGFYGEHNYQKSGVMSKEERQKRIEELKEKLLD